MSGTLKIAGTTLASNPTNSKVVIDDAVSGKGIAKAWVNFDGTLSMTTGSSYGPDAPPADSTSPNPIRASFNVSSVHYFGTGQYGVNLSTAMLDTNYVIIAMSGDNRIIGSGLVGTNTVSQARVSTQVNGQFSDEYVFLAIFR